MIYEITQKKIKQFYYEKGCDVHVFLLKKL